MSTTQVVIRFAGTNDAFGILVGMNDTIEKLFKQLAAEHDLHPTFHFLSFSEKGDQPIAPAVIVQEIPISKSNELFVVVRENAPLVFKIPFLNEKGLKSVAKRVSKIDIGLKDCVGRSLVHLAAQYSPALLKTLIRKKLVDLDEKDNGGNTPLMYAAKSGITKCIQLLVSANATTTTRNNNQETPLHWFCMNTNITEAQCQIVVPLLMENKVNVYSCDLSQNTAAHTAASHQNIIALQYFVEQQYFPIEMTNGDGDTCLHLAVRSRDVTMVKQILQWKGGKFVGNNLGILPLDIAEDLVLPHIISILSEDFIDDECLKKVWDAVKEDDWDALSEIFGSVDDSSSQDSTGSNSSGTSAKILSTGGRRRRGVNRESDSSEQTKLINIAAVWAVARDKLHLLDNILDNYIVDFNVLNSDGSFLLYSLCRTSKPGCSNYMNLLLRCLKAGAGVNERNIEENTCLHIAALRGNLCAIHLLLDNGAFTNAINIQGETELHFAILSGNIEIMNELVKAGSDYNSYQLRNGMSFKDFAKNFGTEEAAQMLGSYNISNCEKLKHPNAAVITVLRAENLNSDFDSLNPFVILNHRLGDKEQKAKTSVQDSTNPEWNESFTFLLKHGTIYYRDITTVVFNDPGGLDLPLYARMSCLGANTIVLDPREESKELKLIIGGTGGEQGFLYLRVEYKQLSDQEVAPILETSYAVYDDRLRINELLKSFNTRSVGDAMKRSGWKLKYPVIIVPGLASTALEVWESPKSSWIRERAWVDPFKIGKTSIEVKISSVLTGKKKKTKKTKATSVGALRASGDTSDDSSLDKTVELNSDQRTWLRHLLLATDGFSDPPGIKLRPATGLCAIDYLATNPLARSASYVFAHVLTELVTMGYTPKNLDAAPYDWRLPPEKLEERDGYYSKLKMNIQFMREQNNERVVLMGHSMGCRNIQYFLWWVKSQENGQKWIDENVHAFFALGGPFLGSPKTVRSAVSGDQLGLEIFLTLEEGRTMSRALASIPWLFPLQESLFPDTVAHVKREKDNSVIKESYDAMDTDEIIDLTAPNLSKFFENFYQNNSLFLNSAEGEELPPALQPPPVENMWNLYGINMKTEVSYYFKKHRSIPGRYVLDTSADKFTGRKIGGINPKGLAISGGVGYENQNTFQIGGKVNRSGDGTVPFCSLAFPKTFWRPLAQEGNIPLKNLINIEVEGAEHRAMLSDPAIIEHIFHMLCSKPN